MTAQSLFIPRSVDEAVGLLGEHGPDLVVMGGGTIVMEQVNDGHLFPRRVMSLKRAGLDEVRRVDGHVEIGATATATRVSDVEGLPPLAQAAGALGGPAVRNMATIGGNLFAASPYGDMAVALLALDAEVGLVGPNGRRTVPLEQFLAARDQTTAALVASVRVPRPAGRTAYVKYGRRAANTPAVVAVAVHVTLHDEGVCRDARIALGAAGPTALRAKGAEAALRGQRLDEQSIATAATAAMAECEPRTDALATDWYRRKMVGVYVRRALEQAAHAD